MGYKLSKDTKSKVSRYVEDGSISRSLISKIMNAESNDDLITTMCNFYNLSDYQKRTIWDYIIRKVWDEEDIDTCFNEYDCIFFKKLIENNGILRRVELSKVKIFKTDYTRQKTVDNLNSMELIDIYRLSSSEIVYILNMRFYKEVFKDAK